MLLTKDKDIKPMKNMGSNMMNCFGCKNYVC